MRSSFANPSQWHGILQELLRYIVGNSGSWSSVERAVTGTKKRILGRWGAESWHFVWMLRPPEEHSSGVGLHLPQKGVSSLTQKSKATGFGENQESRGVPKHAPWTGQHWTHVQGGPKWQEQHSRAKSIGCAPMPSSSTTVASTLSFWNKDFTWVQKLFVSKHKK